MSLFAALTPKPSAPIDNISLTKDNPPKCAQHQEELSKLHFRAGLFNMWNSFAACPTCIVPENLNTSFPASFKTDTLNQCCVISPAITKSSLSFELARVDPPLEFQHRVLEHLLWDPQSNGYGLKSLVYMKDQKVLAGCSKNGSICFWSIGDVIELKEPKLNLEKTVNFAKYFEEKKYFVVGTDQGVHIYNMAEGGCHFLGVIDQGNEVSDLDFLREESKIVAVYNESTAKVWNLETLEMEEKIDLLKYEIKGKIYTVIFMNKTNELAIEHEKGLSVIDWKTRGNEYAKPTVRHHEVAEKKTFGCIHLAESKKFILNNSGQNVQILKEEDFSEESNHVVNTSLFSTPPSYPVKFVSTKDESQVICSSFTRRFDEYNGKSLSKHFLDFLTRRVADVEIMEDQYRIALADQEQKTISIYRINSNMKIQRSQGWPQGYSMPSITCEQTVIPPSPRQINIFSSVNSNGGSLFGNQTPRSLSRKNIQTAAMSQSKKVTTKASVKGKKIKKVQISIKKKSSTVKNEAKGKKTSGKKEIKKKSKIAVVKAPEALKKKQDIKNEEIPVEIVRIRTQKRGTKSPKKEEKVWVVVSSSEDEEKKTSKEIRGRSREKRTSDKKKS